jgi:lipopolysaccharide transport system permease protein
VIYPQSKYFSERGCKTETRITTYEPDNSIKKGYLPLLREIYVEIVNNKWLTYQLFKRDFFAIYRQSFMGFLWAFIVPLVSVGSFIVLSNAGLFTIGNIDVPYPIYAILGMAFWQLFAMGLIASTNSLVNAGSMITKINFSKKSLVLASVGQSLISFMAQFGLVCALFAYYHKAPDAAILLVPLLILPIVLFTLGLGFILSLLNSIMRDTGSMISLMMTFLMFLTPILYVKPTSGLLATITAYNPLYYLISSLREVILAGTIAEPLGFAISVFISAVIFTLSLVIFHLTERRVAERI